MPRMSDERGAGSPHLFPLADGSDTVDEMVAALYAAARALEEQAVFEQWLARSRGEEPPARCTDSLRQVERVRDMAHRLRTR